MENGSSSPAADLQTLQNRVIALERQLADAQAALLTFMAPSENSTIHRFELLKAYSRDSILFIRREDGHILDANAAVIQVYGYSFEELRALSIQDLRAPEVHAQTADQMARADTEGILFETTHRRKDGSTFPVEVSSQGASMGGERILISVIRDISQRARLMATVEQEKIEAQQRAEELRAIIEAMYDPVMVYDREGVIYMANASAIRAHGFDPSAYHRNATNRTLVIRHPDGKVANHDELPSARALRGETVIAEPLEITNAHDRHLIIRVTSAPLIANGVQTGAVSVWHDITEQRQAETALRESEERFSKAFLSSPDALSISRVVDGRIVEVNQSFERLFGCSREQVIGKSSLELDMFKDPLDRQKAIDRVREQGFVRDFELYIRSCNDKEHPVSLSIEKITINHMDHILTVIHDLTERRQAEAALRESEARFRALISASAQVFYRMSPDWREMRQLQGGNFLADTEKPNRNWLSEYIHPDDQRWVLEVIENAVRTGIVFELEHRVLRVDGTLGWTASRAVPVRNAEGEIVEWFGAASDITERKQIEDALRQSEARLRRLVEANIIGVITRNAAGQIKDANNAFLNMVGYTCAELQAGNLDIPQLLPEEYQHLEEQIVEEVLTTGTSQPYEKEYIHKDGQRVPTLVGYTQIEGSADEFIGFVLDLTGLKQAQMALTEYADKLKRSNRDLEQFAFVASHDLQEPLRKIIRFGDSVAGRLKPDMDETTAAEAGDYLQRMQNAAERMQAMIDGLLDLSRVATQGKAFETVDLAEIAAEVISDLEPRIHQERGQVQLGTLPKIEADPLQMRQLIQNLVGNAVKFHRPETPPVIVVHSKVLPAKTNHPGRMVLQVEDNGIGFDEQDAERIFQPFQRLHGRGEYEGTGMGLAICQKIVERHHGTITVHSQPGVGSTFIIELPLRQSA